MHLVTKRISNVIVLCLTFYAGIGRSVAYQTVSSSDAQFSCAANAMYIVSSLVGDIINPLIAAIVGKPDFSALTLTLHGGVIKYGNFLNAAISFFLVASTVYFFIVLPVNALLLRLRGPAPTSTKPCPQCFGDIPLAATRCKFCTQPVAAV